MVFVQSNEKTDYANSKNISFLKSDFAVTENYFKNIPNNSLVILDDFSLNHTKKETKIEFLHVVNYTLRHSKITLFLVIHNLYNVGLFNDILLAPHLILAYSNLGYYIIK